MPFLASYQEPRTQGLRFNGLKAKAGEAEENCRAYFSLEEVLWAKGGFTYAKEDRPGKHPYHEAGLYYIQEPSAMAAAEALEIRPGETVLDLCAAPGEKVPRLLHIYREKGFW